MTTSVGDRRDQKRDPRVPFGPPPLRRAGRKGEWLLAAGLLIPNLALLFVFVYRPLLDNIRLSFTDWNISSPQANYIGFANYVEWFGRDDTKTVFFNTAVFTIATVVLSMALGLALALLLDQKLRAATSCARSSSRPSSSRARPSAWPSSSSSTPASA